MTSPSLRVAIYARVSTHEQTPKNQLRELQAFAKRRGFRVVHELVDIETGANPDRPQLKRLMEASRRREVDVVLVWKFDRFARSVEQLIRTLNEFDDLGVQFISYTQNIDTTTSSGRLFFTLLAAIAEFERDLIRERVRAGIARAREEGRPHGRPALSPATVQDIRLLKRKGLSLRAIATKTGVSHTVVRKYATPARRRHAK